jgi:hypothetical protein
MKSPFLKKVRPIKSSLCKERHTPSESNKENVDLNCQPNKTEGCRNHPLKRPGF